MKLIGEKGEKEQERSTIEREGGAAKEVWRKVWRHKKEKEGKEREERKRRKKRKIEIN